MIRIARLHLLTTCVAGCAVMVLLSSTRANEGDHVSTPLTVQRSAPVHHPTLLPPTVPARGTIAPVIGDSITEETEFSRETIRALMRPNFKFATEWQSKTNTVGISSYRAGVSMPTYPLFGPPPPMVNVGYGYTRLDAPDSLGLPDDLHETEFGLGWMRRVNDRWMLRLFGGTSFATDGKNESSDAWRFRGGAFAIYRRNPRWTWTFGAIALGRNDLPVVPAIGVIHQPNPSLRFDLIMPRPKIAFLIADRGERQQWGYIGAGLNGATWGVQRTDLTDDQLTYGDVRLTLGWESTPTPEPGMPFTRGRKLGLEIGYAFSRDFEWDSDEYKIKLDDTLMLRGTVSF